MSRMRDREVKLAACAESSALGVEAARCRWHRLRWEGSSVQGGRHSPQQTWTGVKTWLQCGGEGAEDQELGMVTMRK